MYEVKISKYSNGKEKYLIVDDKCNIHEAALFYSNGLYTGYKLNTIYDYLLKLTKWLNYLESKGIEWNIASPHIVSKYISYLQGYEEEGIVPLESKLTGATINSHLSALAGFYQELVNYETANVVSPFIFTKGHEPFTMCERFLQHVEVFKVKKRKHKSKQKRNTNINKERRRRSKQEINKFKEQLKPDNLTYKRDILMITLFYETGMRVSELLNLQVYDYSEPGIDGWADIRIIEREDDEYATTQIAKFRQMKTGSRDIVISNQTASMLDEYIIENRPYIEEQLFVFVSHKGKSKGEPLTREGVEKVFRKLSKLSGVKITPHMLRHTHITELTEAGFDNAYIRVRAGHSSMKTTAKYQHPSLKSQAEAYIRFFEKNDNYGGSDD